MPPIRASCQCGTVQLEATPPSTFVCHCHCENCRRAHGAGMVTWAGFDEAGFRVVAGQEAFRRYVAADTGSTWMFCGTCGSPLAYASPRWPGEVHLSVANLLDPLDSPPSRHVYADRAPDWCPITDGLPRSNPG